MPVVKILRRPGVDIIVEGLIFAADGGLICSCPHTGGRKIREVLGRLSSKELILARILDKNWGGAFATTL